MLVQHILDAKKQQAALLTVDRGDTVADATRLLAEHRVGALLVSPDGVTLAGIVTERDVMRELGKRGAAVLEDRVENVMTPEVKTCTVADTVERVMTLMSRGRFRHVPVINERGLVGVLSIRDVMDARLREIETEKGDLEKMVAGYDYSA